MRRPLLRLRLRYTTWPRPALELTDTPRPACWDCGGAGGFETGTPGQDEPEPVTCDCWDPTRAWLLLVVPRWLARSLPGWREPVNSSEPPF